MSQSKLTPEQVSQIRKTLDLARDNQASLGELGCAHDLAVMAGLDATAGELRGYIRHKITPQPARSTGRDLMLGVASGMLTHHLLRGL